MTQPGQIVADRYRIISTLGSGHYGVVYRAEDVSLQKEVALKMLNVTDSNSTNLLRFQKEARAAAKLKHSNIVTVLDFRLDDKNNFYLVLELIDGMSLRSLIASHGRLAPDECIPLFLQVLSGLAHAHENGVIHRDLNPNNILVDFRNPQQPTAKLVDFGLARISDEDQRLTREGVAVGTPEFMSPEQCHGTQIDARSDIYSFGCLMFDALTGEPPHKRDTVVDTIMCHINYDAPSLYDACPDAQWPTQLPEIVAKALSRDPNERYQSADELASALRAIPIEAHAIEAHGIEPEQMEPDETVKTPLTSRLRNQEIVKTVRSVPISVIIVFILLVLMALIVVSQGQAKFDKIFEHRDIERIHKTEPGAKTGTGDTSVAKHRKRKVKALDASVDAQSFGYNLFVEPDDHENSLDFLDSIAESRLLPSRHVDGSFDVVACTEDKDLKVAENHFEITSLRIQTPLRFTGTGLRYLKGLKLTSLHLKKSALTDENLARCLPAIPTLTNLNIGANSELSGATMGTVAEKLPNLKHLVMDGTGLNDDGLKGIANFKNLESLSFGKCRHIRGTNLSTLAALPRLGSLSMSENLELDSKNLPCLSKFPALHSLNLSNCRYQPEDLRFIRDSKLRALYLGKGTLTDEGLKQIAASRTLQFISLPDENKITASGIRRLKDSSITEYNGTGQTMTEDMLNAICDWKNLRIYRATATGLTRGQAERLLKNSKVKALYVGFPITNADVLDLKKRFPGRRIEWVPMDKDSAIPVG